MTHHLDDLGLVPRGFEGEEYIVELRVEPRHLNIGGIVHGGVLCSLLDTAMARSWFVAASGEVLSAATLEMKVNFLAAARDGVLRARGRVIQRTRRTVYVEGRILDEADRLIAAGTATLMILEDNTSPR